MAQMNPDPRETPPDADLLLRAYDDPRSVEAPAGFDFMEATARFLRLAHSITRLVGEECDVDTWPGVRDASFHGEVRLPPSVLTDAYGVAVRASNYGNLITVYDSDKGVEPRVMAALRQLFDDLGYRYISSAALHVRYTGRHAGTTAIRNWGERFFDYT